ncbi:Uncharacterised protein [uncultured archaeon]|nr:Uncharacterised protein [uncultured archaeon]
MEQVALTAVSHFEVSSEAPLNSSKNSNVAEPLLLLAAEPP